VQPRPEVDRLAGFRAALLIGACLFGCLLPAQSRVVEFDLNLDGAINILDLQVLVNAILSGNPDRSADFNGDGSVDVLDLQLLVNRILGIPEPPSQAPRIAGCQIFPADNPWNRDISSDPVDPNSSAYLSHMNGNTKFLHPDFGSNPDYGIPFVVVTGAQSKVPVSFMYADESDPGPYPIPADAPIEGGAASPGDRHVLVLDKDNCLLYETYDSHYLGPGWSCGSGAIFDLTSNRLRPDYWTSADAAGLPILPGLVRYDEVAAGAVNHAIRFTVASTQRGFIHPATHYASSNTDPAAPPMGLRVRLKTDFDLSHFTGAARVILTAMKKYGMILADNGSDWFFTGATDTRWNDTDLNQLKQVPGNAFEVVVSGSIIR
jgi:Dockerin type I domain